MCNEEMGVCNVHDGNNSKGVGGNFTNDQLDMLADIVSFLRTHRSQRLIVEQPVLEQPNVISVEHKGGIL